MKENPSDRLAAAIELLNEARKLVATQEQEVARVRGAGLDPARAQSLLDAYVESLHLAEQELVEAEGFLERAERPVNPAQGRRYPRR